MKQLQLCACLAVLTLAPGASGQPQTNMSGVLLSKDYLGVYRLGPSGPIQRLVGTDIHAAAVAANGTAAGFRASDREQTGPLFLVRGATRTELPHSSGGVGCVAFSADRSLVAYVSGRPTLTKPSSGLDYFRLDGTLWLAEVAHPEHARAIDAGTFATSECPLPAPTGARFAYFLRTASGDSGLRLYRNGGVGTIADDPSPVPSTHDRSFAWAPNGTLGFTRGDDLWIGHNRIAENLATTLAARANSQHARAIDFSANGRFVAVSLGNKTGIFQLNGQLVRVVNGHLIEWSGSQGVLTIGLTKKFQVGFSRFPLRGPSRLLAYYFKLPAVSDPAGAWFAYPEARRSQLVFRRANGSLLRVAQFKFGSVAIPLAAVAPSGRLSVPAGSY